MQTKHLNAIGYIRTALFDSTFDKLNDQAHEITLYCEKNNLNLLHIFQDNGASGLDFNRKGWNDLKDEVRKNKGSIKFLVVVNYDRIGRDISAVSQEIEKLKGDFGIEVCPIKNAFALKDMFTLTGRLSKPSGRRRKNRRNPRR